jgi:hypothetical protein
MGQFGTNKSGFFSTSSSGGGTPPLVNLQDALNNGNINVLTWSINLAQGDTNLPYIEFAPSSYRILVSGGLNDDYVNMYVDGENTNLIIQQGGGGISIYLYSNYIFFTNSTEYLQIVHSGDSADDWEYTLPYPNGGSLSLQENVYGGTIDLTNSNYNIIADANTLFVITNGSITNHIEVNASDVGQGTKIYFLNQAPINGGTGYTDVLVVNADGQVYGSGYLPQGLTTMMRYDQDYYMNSLIYNL